MTSSLAALRSSAEVIALRAGKILAERFESTRTVERKGEIDLVTDADKASEAEVLRFLKDAHPDHAILAEESGQSGGSSYRWLVDPLDGTTNYAHRIPHFCVSIGLEGPEGLLVGVVYDPIRSELFSAARGLGASLNGRRLAVSQVDSLRDAVLCTGFPYDVRENPKAPVGLFSRFIQKAQGVRRMGSAALDLAYVAAGRFEGFFEFGLKPWDIGAGALLVAEAGGAVARIDGEPLDLAFGDMVASSAKLSSQIRATCSEFVREIGWKPTRRHPA